MGGGDLAGGFSTFFDGGVALVALDAELRLVGRIFVDVSWLWPVGLDHVLHVVRSAVGSDHLLESLVVLVVLAFHLSVQVGVRCLGLGSSSLGTLWMSNVLRSNGEVLAGGISAAQLLVVVLSEYAALISDDVALSSSSSLGVSVNTSVELGFWVSWVDLAVEMDATVWQMVADFVWDIFRKSSSLLDRDSAISDVFSLAVHVR